jgi:hypothetical protein
MRGKKQLDLNNPNQRRLLPQEWKKHWPLQAGEHARAEREHALHSIGNLTLVSSKLNPTLFNAQWLDKENRTKGKRSALEIHSGLKLNARLVKGHPNVWDENTIGQRTRELFDAACSIWPDPAALAVT